MNLIEHDIYRQVPMMDTKNLLDFVHKKPFFYTNQEGKELYSLIKTYYSKFNINGDSLDFNKKNLIKIFLLTDYLARTSKDYLIFTTFEDFFLPEFIFRGSKRLGEIKKQKKEIDRMEIEVITPILLAINTTGSSDKAGLVKLKKMLSKQQKHLKSLKEQLKTDLDIRESKIIEFKKLFILYRYICASWDLK